MKKILLRSSRYGYVRTKKLHKLQINDAFPRYINEDITTILNIAIALDVPFAKFTTLSAVQTDQQH